MKIQFSFAWIRSVGAIVILVVALTLVLFLTQEAGLNQFIKTTEQSDLPTVQTTATTSASTAQTSIDFSSQESSLEQTTSSTGSVESTADTTTAPPEHTDEIIAEMWVDGKRVPMTSAQIAEFEEKLYQCKTQAEYEAMMETLACYNKGVDLSRFSWYWDDLQDLYSDEQIAMLKSVRQQKKVPNVVGLEVKEAYKVMINCGLVARFAYYYNPNSDLPVGFCYYQDIEAGTMFSSNACIMVTVQAPREISGEAINWDPDNWDFDINVVAADIRENGRFTIIVPDVVGLTAEDAKAKLESIGFTNIIMEYLYTDLDVAAGTCYKQSFGPGEYRFNNAEFTLRIQILEPTSETTDTTLVTTQSTS